MSRPTTSNGGCKDDWLVQKDKGINYSPVTYGIAREFALILKTTPYT
jgi:hypothetical protein